MAQSQRNLFDVFDPVEQIQTVDSDFEPEIMDSDDEANDPSWEEDVDEPGPSHGRPPAERPRPESNSDTELDDNGWSRRTANYPVIPNFDQIPGLHFPPHSNPTTALDIFNLIFHKELVKIIKRETNRYATQEIIRVGQTAKPNSIHKLWKPVTMNDIRGVFTLLVHMSLIPKPRLSDYWSKDPILTSPFASQIMSRDRFVQIMAFLHLNNNETYIPRNEVGHQPLHKIQPVYDSLRASFSSLYTPDKKLTIDEAICPWRGKLKFRVYMKDKPCKWGIKLYELCETKSGYVCDFEVYSADQNFSNRPTDVCMRLMEPYLGIGHYLYTDNYYTCPTLSTALKVHNTMSIGTVRHNRLGMPKGLATQRLALGASDYRVKDGLCVVKWMDRKAVHILTTVHDPSATQEVTTRTQTKMKPVAVQDYILNMAGVDRSDQLMAYMPLRRRTLKWWKKLFMHLFTLTLIQSKILYMKFKGSSIRVEDFLVQLGNEMAEDYFQHKAELQRKRDTPPIPTPVPTQVPTSRLVAKHGHYPEPIPSTTKKEKPYRACKVCYMRQVRDREGGRRSYKRQETRYWCPTCKIALCVTPCFQEYHTQKNIV